MNTSNLPPHRLGQAIEVIRVYTWLGLTAFGGPVCFILNFSYKPYAKLEIGQSVHVQIMLRQLVEKRQWLDATTYADIWALGAALPGPASTQLGFGIALLRYGLPLALLAFFCWSLPGAIGMAALAVGAHKIPSDLPPIALSLLTGLNAAAVGLIATSALTLSNSTTTDGITRALLFVSAAASTCFSASWLYPVLTLGSGLVTLLWDQLHVVQRVENFRNRASRRRISATTPANQVELSALPNLPSPPSPALAKSSNIAAAADPSPSLRDDSQSSVRSRRFAASSANSVQNEVGQQPTSQTRQTQNTLSNRSMTLSTILLGLFAINLAVPLGLKAAQGQDAPRLLQLYANLALAGTIIFGGGPVVVPLLYGYVVEPGWVSPQLFLLGYSILQSFPGPNFNIAAYLGYLCYGSDPFLGAFLGWLAIFSPGILLKAALMPFYRRFGDKAIARSLFRGLNPGAAGLIWSAVYRLWIVGALLPEGKSGSLDRSGWWVVVAACAFLSDRWARVPPWATILAGSLAGLVYFAVVKRSP